MKSSLLLILFFVFPCLQGRSQDYLSYFTGNKNDVITSPMGGVCLMGGASEDDNAMKWFLNRVDGGDVLVIRASGSDGYNDYLYADLALDINSVETLIFYNMEAANLPEIQEKIQNAEGIWIAGGNQSDYVSLWRNTPVSELINEGILQRNIVVGGTSAGMAILGDYYFSAMNGTVYSTLALNVPYNSNVVVDSSSFLSVPYLDHVITDTHYDDPDRKGRHVVFLARAFTDYNTITRGIACDEYTAVCIDEFGIASVFGGYPNYDDNAYFIVPNCELVDPSPEVCAPGSALEWNHNGQALNVYQVKGTIGGANHFDLNTWQTGEGGSWMYWSVEDGTLYESDGTEPQCATNVQDPTYDNDAIVYPVPTSHTLYVSHCQDSPFLYETPKFSIIDRYGRDVQASHLTTGCQTQLDCSHLADGIYQIIWNHGRSSHRFIVAH